MEVFVARHPIFDEHKDVYGYELGFRSGFVTYYEALEKDKSAVDLMAFVNFGELTDGKKGFVKFPRNLLAMGFPVLFSSDAMTAGVPGTIDGDPQILAQCRELKSCGYTLAITDFRHEYLDSPLLEFADIAEIDFPETPAAQRPELCRQLSERGIRSLARQVETSEEFDQAVSWGYSYFHGPFFTKPVTRPDNEIAAGKLTYLRLLREVNSPALSYDEIADLVEQDVALTYKLLRFMNSAWFGLRFEVRSVKHALVLLGPKEIRRWVALAAVRSTGEDKPYELLVRSLTRAKAAEQIALLTDLKNKAPELFLMGMFSLIDALTDNPMSAVLAELPLKEAVKEILLEDSGPYKAIHDTLTSYEQGDWELFSTSVEGLGIDENALPPLFRASTKWANDALAEM